MPEYDNTNSGAMFFEQEPETERHPNYKGSINVDGKDYWISAWDKVSKKGANFISLTVKQKEVISDNTLPEKQSGYEKAKGVRNNLQKNVTDNSPTDLSNIPF